MLLLLPVFLLLGLFVPGFFIAKGLRHPLWWASAFPISLLVLFHDVFWLEVFGVPLTLWTALPGLVVVSASGWWWARRTPLVRDSSLAESFTRLDQALLIAGALVGIVLCIRCAASPLLGGDTSFRWDWLAQKIFALHTFSFYPPLAAADFRTYFFVDGIPPLVSFTNWWLYASAGRYLPALICVFVTLQYVATLAFTFGTASAIFSRRAGVLAAAILASSALYFDAVMQAQETGLTALAIVATLYFIVTSRDSNDVAAMVSAGLAAALCALSREYGWIALIVGAIALLWRKQALKQLAIFGVVAAIVAAPWYVRNWMLAGNPFYSISFANFAVNPIHAAILQFYKTAVGSELWTATSWTGLLWFFLIFAPFALLAGIPGAFLRFRQHGYLAVIAVVLTAVWIQSVGYTSGGVIPSTRVLSIVLVVLSITGAGLLDRFAGREPWRGFVAAALVICELLTAAHGALYPNNPFTLSLGQWPASAFQSVAPLMEFQISEQLGRILPPGSRVLSDNAYLHASLADRKVDVVPVWSPEVRFLFSVPPEEAERRLRALHIENVALYLNSLNTNYLMSHSAFYTALPKRWKVKAQVQDTLYILAP